MKIRDCKDNGEVEFRRLGIGATFRFNRQYFINSERNNNATRIAIDSGASGTIGMICHFELDTMVEKVTLELCVVES
tara:strand:+ start:756 stop:986 length:231 start_codon:yes stop_codon:yes gene_type:complete